MQIMFPSRSLSRTALIGAGVLLSAAAFVRYLTYKAENAPRPLGKNLTVRGHNIFVLDRGRGQAIVLLHGNGGMIEDFASTPLIGLLSQKYRVIAVDRPGFGLSTREVGTWSPSREAELLRETLRILDVDEPILVAHSWATLVALHFALQAGNGVKGLVLLSGYYYPTTRLDVALQTPASLPIIGPVLRNTFLPLLSRVTASSTFKKLFSPRAVPMTFKNMFSVPLASRPSQLKSVADDTVGMPRFAREISVRYDEIHCPVRIVAGAEDQVVSCEQSAKLHRALPASTIDVLPSVGHMSHHADPALVMRLVEELSKPSDQPASDVLEPQKIFVG